MNDVAIKVENLTKVYHLYDKPQDRLKEALHPFRKSYHRDFYALNDISFEIKKGETVGVIGKNGAGKSTLLKILTGVLTPSYGQVFIDGNVASLLELGAGFNPEMTGIENIFLHGALRGLSHKQIRKKLDDIIEFADIGDFIKQPVKNYSSGMFARLAFSVAINVEPDILIVDEALSVGDIKFQTKCINKFKELQKKGVTILFVSHDVFSIRNFCNKAIWIDRGKIREIGDVTSVTAHFTEYMHNEATSDISDCVINKNNKEPSMKKKREFDAINRWGDKIGIIEFVEMYNEAGLPSTVFQLNETIIIKMIVNTKDITSKNLSFAISIKNKNGIDLIVSTTKDENIFLDSSQKKIEVEFVFQNYLETGEYILVAAVEDRTIVNVPKYYDYIEGACYFKSEVSQIRFGLFHQPVKKTVRYFN